MVENDLKPTPQPDVHEMLYSGHRRKARWTMGPAFPLKKCEENNILNDYGPGRGNMQLKCTLNLEYSYTLGISINWLQFSKLYLILIHFDDFSVEWSL